MILKWFCDHDYKPVGTAYGESFIDSTYAVVFMCRKCLKNKYDTGYGSKESAERAVERLQELMK